MLAKVVMVLADGKFVMLVLPATSSAMWSPSSKDMPKALPAHCPRVET